MRRWLRGGSARVRQVGGVYPRTCDRFNRRCLEHFERHRHSARAARRPGRPEPAPPPPRASRARCARLRPAPPPCRSALAAPHPLHDCVRHASRRAPRWPGTRRSAARPAARCPPRSGCRKLSTCARNRSSCARSNTGCVIAYSAPASTFQAKRLSSRSKSGAAGFTPDADDELRRLRRSGCRRDRGRGSAGPPGW